MKTIIEALDIATAEFNKAEIPSARLDATVLLADVLSKPKEYLIAHGEAPLTSSEIAKFNTYTLRRIGREPVCYITGKLEFYGLEFSVDKRVLSPRAETELIVEQVIRLALPDSTLIDIGTGSGAIAVAIAKHRPDIRITATEVSAEALDVARLNAEIILGKNHAIEFIIADIWQGVEGVFEIVATNLPYVSKDYLPNMKPEVQKEPAIALFGGSGDGLDLYRRFYQGITSHIATGSKVFHESDPWQHEALLALAREAGLKPILQEYLILGFEK